MSSIEPVVPLPSGGREVRTERTRAFRFGGTLALLLGTMGVWVLHRGYSTRPGHALLAGAGVILVYSLVHPRGALLLRAGWLWFGSLLGRVNSAILLSVVYFLILTPLGVGRRLFGRRTFRRPHEGSYFIARGEDRDSKHFEHPY
jgi:hypothetical protein